MTDMDKMMIEPCPLCGDSDDFNPSISASFKYAQPGRARPSLVKAGAYIECDKCGCCGPTKLTEAEAIAAWNTRNPDDRLREALEWLGENTRMALEHHSPVYCDDADQSVEWRVTERRGNINDREYLTVGRGETPINALRNARATLSDNGGV